MDFLPAVAFAHTVGSFLHIREAFAIRAVSAAMHRSYYNMVAIQLQKQGIDVVVLEAIKDGNIALFIDILALQEQMSPGTTILGKNYQESSKEYLELLQKMYIHDSPMIYWFIEQISIEDALIPYPIMDKHTTPLCERIANPKFADIFVRSIVAWKDLSKPSPSLVVLLESIKSRKQIIHVMNIFIRTCSRTLVTNHILLTLISMYPEYEGLLLCASAHLLTRGNHQEYFDNVGF